MTNVACLCRAAVGPWSHRFSERTLRAVAQGGEPHLDGFLANAQHPTAVATRLVLARDFVVALGTPWCDRMPFALRSRRRSQKASPSTYSEGMLPMTVKIPVLSLMLGSILIAGCDQHTPNTAPLAANLAREGRPAARADRVLLISVDGLHAVDLTRYIDSHPQSTLARLSHHGTSYLNVSTAKPSDSWPGLLAMVTGGSPKSTGILYEVSYDRSLSAPGSNCSTTGTVVDYSEFVDVDQTRIDGGGGINPNNLPRDPAHGCTPVYPHSYLRTNTIFEVIKASGRRTAWSDKSLGYEVVNGPSGHGVDDLYTPEISAPLPNGETPTTSVPDVEIYDTIKVRGILNEIDGLDHTGTTHVGVPAIFGMNFQSVSVGQKTAGYVDAAATPTAPLANALDFVDAQLGRMVAELKQNGLLSHTLIVISAKHGQAPIDPALRRIVSNKLVPSIVNGVQSGLLAAATLDDIAILWLTDASKTSAVVSALDANASSAGIASILSGATLANQFNDPATDPRAPNIVTVVTPGVIYAKPTATKQSEHGGFGHDDTAVPILLSMLADEGIDGAGQQVLTPVTTSQIAPTILAMLGLDPMALDAVRREGTRPLPAPAE